MRFQTTYAAFPCDIVRFGPADDAAAGAALPMAPVVRTPSQPGEMGPHRSPSTSNLAQTSDPQMTALLREIVADLQSCFIDLVVHDNARKSALQVRRTKWDGSLLGTRHHADDARCPTSRTLGNDQIEVERRRVLEAEIADLRAQVAQLSPTAKIAGPAVTAAPAASAAAGSADTRVVTAASSRDSRTTLSPAFAAGHIRGRAPSWNSICTDRPSQLVVLWRQPRADNRKTCFLLCMSAAVAAAASSASKQSFYDAAEMIVDDREAESSEDDFETDDQYGVDGSVGTTRIHDANGVSTQAITLTLVQRAQRRRGPAVGGRRERQHAGALARNSATAPRGDGPRARAPHVPASQRAADGPEPLWSLAALRWQRPIQGMLARQ